MQQALRIAMIRVFVAMVAAISAVALAVPATGVARSRTSADYPVYHVANSGIGVRLRHSPHAGDTYPMGVGPHDGNAFQLVCQDWGDPMGTRDNHIWDYIYWAGYVAWIPDVWTDTPAPANQYSYTHPCPASVGGSGGPVQPPSSGPYMAAAAAVYWCTSLAPLCNASLSLPAGTGVRMACWRDDAQYTGRYASPRWFYVIGGGVEGYVHSSFVERQSRVPNCNNVNWIRASDWALAHFGQTYASPFETAQFTNQDWAPGPPGEWQGDFVKFVDLAWLYAGVQIPKANAIGIYRAYQKLNMVHLGPAPRGALVFFNLTSYGHVAVSLGNGQSIGTYGMDNQRPIQATGWRAASGSSYLGWVMPAAPTVPAAA